jgi:hypothetical protein
VNFDALDLPLDRFEVVGKIFHARGFDIERGGGRGPGTTGMSTSGCS